MEANLNTIVKELSNINKNLQSINMALLKEKQFDDESPNHDDILSICMGCPQYHHKEGDVKFCVHLESCRRAVWLS